MPKITFYVRSTIEGQPATIYLRHCDFWVKTPESIFPEYWDTKKKWVRTGKNISYTSSFTERMRIELEKRLYGLKLHISNQRLGYTGAITKDWIEGVVNAYYNITVNKESVYEYGMRYVEEMRSGKRMNGMKRYSGHSIETFKSTVNTLGEYQGIYTEKRTRLHIKRNLPMRKKISLSFDDITPEFIEDFKAFCMDRKYRANHISGIIERLKIIMRAAKGEEITTSEEYKKKAFKTTMQETHEVYLTEAEIERIYSLNLSMDKDLDKARDIFLCGCYTLQRYSDYSVFKKENVRVIDGVKVLEFTQHKTTHRIVIPVRPELEAILSKYDYTLPHVPYSTMSGHLRLVCKMAKIDEVVCYEEYIGGMRVKKESPKYLLVSTHTARRSGATNLLMSGASRTAVMKMGGWKSESSMMKYLRMGAEEMALSLRDNPFFKGNALKVV